MTTDHWPLERVMEMLMETLPWTTEMVAGVPHLVPGQHRAAPFATDDEETPVAYVAIFAANDGHGRNVLVADYETVSDVEVTWRIVPAYVRFDRLGRRERPLDFEPDRHVMHALERARGLGAGGYYLRGRDA